jgi:hypothetical protein
MEIAFNTKSLRSLCQVETEMSNKFGSAVTEALRVCLADLRAAVTIADVTSGYAADMVSKNEIKIIPYEGIQIRLRANERQLRRKKGDVVDWTKVTRVKIMEISRRA